MKNESSENYLDQLLNSVGAGERERRPKKPTREPSPMEALEQELFGEPDTPETMTAKDEEAFLREFEQELLTEDIPHFDDDIGEKNSRSAGTGLEETDASIDDMLSHMEAYDGAPIPEPAVDEDADFDGPVPGERVFPTEEELAQAEAVQTLDAAMDAFDENLPPEETNVELPLTEDGEVDLSGMGDSDLMDILSGQDGMEDLGDMLAADSTGEAIDGVDEIGNFAEGEMEAQAKSAEADEEVEEEGKGKRRRKKKKKKEKESKDAAAEDGQEKKKGGFFSKLSKLFFGDDEENQTDEILVTAAEQGVDVSQLSDENMQILKELEGTGGEDIPELTEDGKKKKKGKKEKKPKKEKEKKPKKEPKPKKEKPPKPKKEKKPKEKDNTPPLPRGPVIAIVIMVASLASLVLLGTNLLGYQSAVNGAKELYNDASYAEAYEALSGIEVKEKDQPFYNRLSVLAPVSSEYNTYLIFSNADKDDIALDALICAYGRYDLNKERAGEYECVAELEELGSKVLKSLLEDYDMTGQEALDIYNARTRKQYTLLLHEKLQSLGLE